MINEKIDSLISSAMKNQEKFKLEVLRAIKNEFILYRTSRDAKPLNDILEVQILKKMVGKRKEASEIYKNAGNLELAEKEEKEAAIISEFLPPEITEEEIRKALENYTGELNIGSIIRYLKNLYPTASGKLISDIAKEKLRG